MITVAEVLRKARKNKQISLEELSEKTKIRQKYLKALEDGAWEKLPGLAYTRGFLKSYARSVELEPEKVLALFRREFKQEEEVKLLPGGFLKPLNRSKNLLLTIKNLVSKMFSV